MDDESQSTSVHAIGVVPSPPQIMRPALKLYPWQVREHDSTGNLALHLPCRQQLKHGFDDLQSWLPSLVLRDDESRRAKRMKHTKFTRECNTKFASIGRT
jgi:hypothetical protein